MRIWSWVCLSRANLAHPRPYSTPHAQALIFALILIFFLTLSQVDGFRFDIMSCLMVSTMEKARDALRGLTLERDGVDGSLLYFYGEGWDFGEVCVQL